MELNKERVETAFKLLSPLLRSSSKRIMAVLTTEKQCVTDVLIKARMDQTFVSTILNTLVGCGVVKRQKKGKAMYYFIYPEGIKNINDFTNEIAP